MLGERVVAALRARGIEQLFSHQARVWELVERGRHVVVVTPTASGKTLCYNLPALQALLAPPEARRAVRARANLVLTNPDMLHSGILPHHTKWANLFQNLKYIVIDELHAYRGVFGSHLANVIRRLKRICAHYGSTPQFIMASATIANPGELASRITGEAVDEITESGAPTGEKTFV